MVVRPNNRIRRRIVVAACALAATAALAPLASAQAEVEVPGEDPPKGESTGRLGPFRGDGMWIWYISQSNHGNLDAIADRAKRRGVETLYIKSSDGTGAWSQFNSKMIKTFQRRGLKVCGWQYVYGRNPKAEAKAAATAASRGADCFVIDAETEYEGRYVAADRYMRALRSRTGKNFPIGFTSFPYVDYHPWMPYSVFLRKGASSVNLPQVYWRAIGSSVQTTLRHTHVHNRIYGAPIAPIGQTYRSPPGKEIIKFRRISRSYGMRGVSWWSWQDTNGRSWKAVGKRVTRIKSAPPGKAAYPVLSSGRSNDQVIWAQEHLVGAGYNLPVTGHMANKTATAVRAFQSKKGLPVTGVINGATWKKLLLVDPKDIHWGGKGNPSASGRTTSGRTATRSLLPGARSIMEMPPTPGRP